MKTIAPFNPSGMVANIPWKLIVNSNNFDIFLNDSYNKFLQGSKWSGKSRHGAIEAVFEVVNFPHRNVVIMKKNRTGQSGHYHKTFKDIKNTINEIEKYVPNFSRLWVIKDKSEDNYSIAYIGNWSDPKKQELLFTSMDYDATAGLKTGYDDVFYTKIWAEEIVDGNDDGEIEDGHTSKYLEFKYFQRLQSNVFRFNEEEKAKYNLRAQTIFTFNPWSMGHWLYLENTKYIDFYDKEMEKTLATKGNWFKVIEEYWFNEVNGTWTSAFFQINNWRTLLAENNQHGVQFISDDIIASILGNEDPASARVLNYGLPSIPKGTILQGVLHKIRVEDVNFHDKICISIGIDIGGTDPYSLHFHWTTRDVTTTSDGQKLYTTKPTWKELILAHEWYYDPLKTKVSLSEQRIAEAIVNHIFMVNQTTQELYGRSIFDNEIGMVLIKIDNNNQEFVDFLEFAMSVKGVRHRFMIEKVSNKNELEHLITQRNTDFNLIIGAGKLVVDRHTTYNWQQHAPTWRMSSSGNGKMVHTNKHTNDSSYYAFMDFKGEYTPLIQKTLNPNPIFH